MGIFGPSRRQVARYTAVNNLMVEYESALRQGMHFVNVQTEMFKHILPGLKSADEQVIVESCSNVYGLVYTLRYCMIVVRQFNKGMGTLFADTLTSDEKQMLELLEKATPMLGKILPRVKARVFDADGYTKYIDFLNNRYGSGKYGIDLETGW